MKGRLRRALFVASLAATAIAGLAAGAVSAITNAASGSSVAADLLWTAGGFLLVAFVVVAEGTIRRRFHCGARGGSCARW
jgi:purine-cytosine permease-like protein